MSALRRLGRIGGGVAVAVAGLLTLALAGPLLFGARPFTVMSGSMEPAIHTGDVVVNDTIRPSQARIGDVLTFRDPADQDRLITHRLRSMRRRGARIAMVTRGDANTGVERWTVPIDGRIGRVVYRVPRVGYFLAWARGPGGRLLLVTIPAALLAALELASLWRGRPRERSGDAAA